MKLLPIQIEEIKKLYSEGKGLSELGRQFSCDHSTIFYHVNTVFDPKRLELKRQRAREYKNLSGKLKIYVKRKGKYPDYHHKSEVRLDLNKNSQYAEYLKKEKAKDRSDLPISILFAHRMIQR